MSRKGGFAVKDMIQYKGYYGSVHYSDVDQVLFGKVEYIRSLINYEGTDTESIKLAMEKHLRKVLKQCWN